MKKKLMFLIILIGILSNKINAQFNAMQTLENITVTSVIACSGCLPEVVVYGNNNSMSDWDVQNYINYLNSLYQNSGGCDGNGGSVDGCGVCGGNGSSCSPPPISDCNGVVNGSAYIDPECGVCMGGNTGIAACPPPLCNSTTNPNFAASGAATISQGTHSAANNIINLPYAFGLTIPERVNPDITVCYDGSSWKAVLNSLTAEYSFQTRMRPGVIQISGTTFTIQSNFCQQATDLKATTYGALQFYNIDAVIAHENVHKAHFQPSLNQVIASIETYFETYLLTSYTGQTAQQAIQEIKNNSTLWNAAKDYAFTQWKNECDFAVIFDHGITYNGPAYVAERQITDPIRSAICALASTNSWGFCSGCY